MEKLIEFTREELKAGKKIDLKKINSPEFIRKMGIARSGGDGPASDFEYNPASVYSFEQQFCHHLNGHAAEYFADHCKKKHATINGLVGPKAGGKCEQAKLPILVPSLTLKWADSRRDNMETEDIETICVTATNPYSNITFNGFDLTTSWYLDPSFNTPSANNDGTPSSSITPPHKLCFGDLGPCQSASREVVLINRNAHVGRYYWVVFFCSKWSALQIGIDAFPLDFVAS